MLSELGARLIAKLQPRAGRDMPSDAMTEEEIHAFGIEIVLDHVREQGFVPSEVQTDSGSEPQIVAQKDGSETERLAILRASGSRELTPRRRRKGPPRFAVPDFTSRSKVFLS